MARPEKVGRRLPKIVPGLALAALATWFLPRLGDVLVYDRDAVLAGQIWRLVTAPLVHFSASHLGWDLLVFATAGWWVEATGDRGFPVLCALAAAVPGPVFLLWAPDLARYGGLSGVATASVAYLCLRHAAAGPGNRGIWLAMLAATVAKIAVEWSVGFCLFARSAGVAFRVLPAAHLIGLGAAFVVHLCRVPGRDGAASRPGLCCPAIEGREP